MPTKSLLINYNDCPSSLDSLIPDNGLANLAGSLIAKGHQTQILDYSTIQTLRDFRPPKIRKKLKRAFLRYKLETKFLGKMTKSTYQVFREIDEEIEICRRKKIQEIVNEIDRKISVGKLDFIAFKLWSGEGFLGSIRIAKEIKKIYPYLKIFAGGPHVEIFGEDIFPYTDGFDILCQGEGEEVIALLSDYVEGKLSLGDIPSIIYRKDNKIESTPVKFINNLDSISDPVYSEDVYPAMGGDNKVKIIMLEESRGCPYVCNFCIHRIKSGDRWRIKSIDNVINSVKKISAQVNTTAFKFSGSNTPHFFREQLAGRLISEDIKIKYIGFADTRQPEQENYNLLKKSGCVSLFFGVESADPYLLEHIINKKTDPEWIRNSLIRARKAGILTAASIIVPCPGQTQESVRKTINLLVEAKPYGVSVYPAVCYPKTKWFTENKKFGFDLSENIIEKMMVSTIKFTMPPPMLLPLPFKLDGKDFYKIMNETIDASRQLEKRGIVTSLNDALLLIAEVLKISPRQIKTINQKSMILGECDKLKNKISIFNRRIATH